MILMYFDFKKLSEFQFQDPGELIDRELTLKLVDRYPGDAVKKWVPSYNFDMQHTDTRACMGQLRFRAASTEDIIRYNGHIGYNVHPEFRGNNLAERACRLIFSFAKKHGLKELWITCDPENIASKQTIELLGGKLIEIVEIPADSEMYQQGARKRCRYLISLN